MSEIVKTEPLENGGWLEYWDSGRIQAKDAEGHYVAHPDNYLPPNEAQAIKAGRTKRRSAVTLSEVEELLDVLPQDVLEDPREAWIIRHLVASLVVGGAGAASVARELI